MLYSECEVHIILNNRNRNRSMSVTISTCNQICNAPTNQSSAKMLYSFPKQSRFLKRKTILYASPHADAIDSTISRAPSPPGEQVLAMDISMISPKNHPHHHHPTPITSIAHQTKRPALPSEKVEKEWWSPDLWSIPFKTRTQALVTIKCRTNVRRSATLFQGRSK